MRYFVIDKPFGMLSQFTREANHKALSDLEFTFPKDVYPVGRLDHDSEGLLVLTNDTALKTKLLEPRFKTPKTYWAQVDGAITKQAIINLKKGVSIKHKGKVYQTFPCLAREIETPDVPERISPIRFRKSIPTSWIEIIVREGKNRQIRKMTAAVGFPTLRLLRVGIGKLSKPYLKGASVKEVDRREVYELLGIK